MASEDCANTGRPFPRSCAISSRCRLQPSERRVITRSGIFSMGHLIILGNFFLRLCTADTVVSRPRLTPPSRQSTSSRYGRGRHPKGVVTLVPVVGTLGNKGHGGGARVSFPGSTEVGGPHRVVPEGGRARSCSAEGCHLYDGAQERLARRVAVREGVQGVPFDRFVPAGRRASACSRVSTLASRCVPLISYGQAQRTVIFLEVRIASVGRMGDALAFGGHALTDGAPRQGVLSRRLRRSRSVDGPTLRRKSSAPSSPSFPAGR